MTRIRSKISKAPNGQLSFRPSDDAVVPLPALPESVYLKARGSNPPRTWVSGLGEKVRRQGLGEVVAAARRWYVKGVEQLLSDATTQDVSGDYLEAWLREAHPKIYRDVDEDDHEFSELTTRS